MNTLARPVFTNNKIVGFKVGDRVRVKLAASPTEPFGDPDSPLGKIIFSNADIAVAEIISIISNGECKLMFGDGIVWSQTFKPERLKYPEDNDDFIASFYKRRRYRTEVDWVKKRIMRAIALKCPTKKEITDDTGKTHYWDSIVANPSFRLEAQISHTEIEQYLSQYGVDTAKKIRQLVCKELGINWEIYKAMIWG